MSRWKTRRYEAEIADTSKDGKQVHIMKRTEDRYRPDETKRLETIDLEQAKELHESLEETIARLE